MPDSKRQKELGIGLEGTYTPSRSNPHNHHHNCRPPRRPALGHTPSLNSGTFHREIRRRLPSHLQPRGPRRRGLLLVLRPEFPLCALALDAQRRAAHPALPGRQSLPPRPARHCPPRSRGRCSTKGSRTRWPTASVGLCSRAVACVRCSTALNGAPS